MPNLKSLKAFRKLMQERGLLEQIKETSGLSPQSKLNTFKTIASLRSGEDIDDIAHAAEIAEGLNRRESFSDQLESALKLKQSKLKTQEDSKIINDLIRQARELRNSDDRFYRGKTSVHDDINDRAWQRKNLKTNIFDKDHYPLSGDYEIDKKAADTLRLARAYPTKNLDNNRDFRNMLQEYKQYGTEPFDLMNAPAAWKNKIKEESMEKWNQIRSLLEKKKSE